MINLLDTIVRSHLFETIARFLRTPAGGLVPTGWPHRSDTYNHMRARLERVRRGEAPIEHADLEYWGGRFVEQNVRYWTGCTFRRYLFMPEYWERIASARAEAHARRRGVRAFATNGPGGRFDYSISHS